MTRTLLAAISGVAFGLVLGVSGHHFSTSMCRHHAAAPEVVLVAPPMVQHCDATTTVIIASAPDAPETGAVVDVDKQADRNLAQARSLASKDPQKASQLCRETMLLYHNNPHHMRVRAAFRLLNHIKSSVDYDDL